MPSPPEKRPSMRFEITFLDAAGEQTRRTVDVAEIGSLLAVSDQYGPADVVAQGSEVGDTERKAVAPCPVTGLPRRGRPPHTGALGTPAPRLLLRIRLRLCGPGP
jgi:hypothetical protein